MNEDADLAAFIRDFKPNFPVGKGGGLNALEYLQWPRGQRPLVPMMVFIDRTGMIRAQYTGYDATFFNDDQDQHIREEIEKLLKSGKAPAKGATKSAKSSAASH